ncbi:MAG: hypothetical protein J0I06_07450 [Planctomycetes bacterium]|nr:hypothetical protein [Planctomycetota bacterium]
MPTSPGLSRKYPHGYPAPRKFALVVSCVDCRLLDDLVRFLDHDNLTNRYYQVTFAGCALGLSGAAPEYHPQCDHRGKHRCVSFDLAKWKDTLRDHLRLVLELTNGGLTDVYIVEHADCGAYAALLGADYYADPANPDLEGERQAHYHYAMELANELVAWYEMAEAKELGARLGVALQPPLVRGFLMDLRGGVELLFDPSAVGRRAKKARAASAEDDFV